MPVHCASKRIVSPPCWLLVLPLVLYPYLCCRAMLLPRLWLPLLDKHPAEFSSSLLNNRSLTEPQATCSNRRPCLTSWTVEPRPMEEHPSKTESRRPPRRPRRRQTCCSFSIYDDRESSFFTPRAKEASTSRKLLGGLRQWWAC